MELTDLQIKHQIELVTHATVNVITGGLEVIFSDDNAQEMPEVLAEIAAMFSYHWTGSEWCIVYECLPEYDRYVIRVGDERIK